MGSSGGLRVLVTAGGSGIGRAIARGFTEEGSAVHICDVDGAALEAVLAEAAGVTASECDVRDVLAVEKLFDDVRARLGGLDVLVNNAGIPGPTMPIEEFDHAAWAEVLAVNLTGTFQVTQRAIPLLKDSQQASVIVLSSTAGLFGYPNRVAYATTKWGLVGFTKTLALELGPFGITANTIHPGPVEGARMRGVMQGRSVNSGRTVEEEMQLALANQAIERFATGEDVAAAAIFLAGPGGRLISGQTLAVDGFSRGAP